MDWEVILEKLEALRRCNEFAKAAANVADAGHRSY
jgi:hypothetical protein